MKSLRYMIPTIAGSILIGTAISIATDNGLVGGLFGTGITILISLFFINEE